MCCFKRAALRRLKRKYESGYFKMYNFLDSYFSRVIYSCKRKSWVNSYNKKIKNESDFCDGILEIDLTEENSKPKINKILKIKEEEELIAFYKDMQSEVLAPEFDIDNEEVLKKVVNRSYFTVVIYDIMDNKRRVKVAKELLGYGDRVQYSGFESYLTQKQIDRLTERLKILIDHTQDRIRIYKISGKPQVTVFGNIPMTFEEEFTII